MLLLLKPFYREFGSRESSSLSMGDLRQVANHGQFCWWHGGKVYEFSHVASSDSVAFIGGALQNLAGKVDHPGKGPFPGILDTYILKGGPFELRAALLAKRGFAVLALAYQNYQDLPRKADKFHLEYFEEGINYLRQQPEVKGQKIGLVSISKSVDLALSMSTFLPDISATVWINGCNANTLVPLYYKDICIPPLMFDVKKTKMTTLGVLDMADIFDDPVSNECLPGVIPIERAPGNFMFVASEADGNWRSIYHAKLACERLKAHGKNNYELLQYEKAGHFIEVPYMPFCLANFHGLIEKNVLFGGEPKAHSEAQEDAWPRIINFFKTHLEAADHNPQQG